MQSGFTTTNQFYTYIPSTAPSPPTNKLILFLHGLGSTQNFYFSLVHHFSPTHNVLLLDHEGAGNSQLHHPNMTLADLAANVTATLTELKLASHELILVGHSMSGMLVNYITATCPELNISRNVLVAPVHPSAQLSGAIGSRIGVLEEAQQLGPLGNSIPDAATGPGATGLQRAFIRSLILGNSVEGYCANCRAIMSGETCGLDYAKVKVPTLVVYGKYDKTSPWTGCIEEIAKGLRDVVTLKELPVGHWIAIEDDEGLASIMKEFIIN